MNNTGDNLFGDSNGKFSSVNVALKKQPRVLFFAKDSSIENYGIMMLMGVARDEGWERKVVLFDESIDEVIETVDDFNPDILAGSAYTGHHKPEFEVFDRVKKDYPGIITAMGGHHATYHPRDAIRHADYVVMSEGHGVFRKMLRGELLPGIHTTPEGNDYNHPDRVFPHPDRVSFYRDYPKYAKSPIKSMMTMTGCPFDCFYCFNSSKWSDIDPDIAEERAKAKGMAGRLFPKNIRTLDALIKEGREVAELWPDTLMIYDQDDVSGIIVDKFDKKGNYVPGSIQEVSEVWPREVGIPTHHQIRWELTEGDMGSRRLEFIRKMGGIGITAAIESSISVVRREVLGRNTSDELVYNGMKKLKDYGFLVRTEQISALPLGRTSQPSLINLDADIDLLRYNIDLFERTGGPDMAWVSTLAPYMKTRIYELWCKKYGYYESDDNNVPERFFARSVQRFLKEWVGPDSSVSKDDPNIWLAPDELERYRDQNAEFRRRFNFFFYVPDGDVLASNYLRNNTDYSDEVLGRETFKHLIKRGLTRHPIRSVGQLFQTSKIYLSNGKFTHNPVEKEHNQDLAPYFGVLPHGEFAIRRYLNYGRNRGFSPNVLSDATRHHLYDNVLYHNGGDYKIDSYRENEVATSRQSTLKI